MTRVEKANLWKKYLVNDYIARKVPSSSNTKDGTTGSQASVKSTGKVADTSSSHLKFFNPPSIPRINTTRHYYQDYL